jgi:alkylation response protein AidB-like acyl-CoA dehydrogenase
MDFDDTPDEAAFRSEARAWLAAHAGPRDGSLARLAKSDPKAHLAANRAWQRTLYDGGWAGITWPVAYGGRGGSAVQAAIFAQEQGRFEVTNGAFTVAISMAGPTLMTHGTDAQRSRYIDAMLRGDEVWCQLFSEPGAGSDLAGLSTRATPQGDTFVVEGQKVWTSGAHDSDWGILLARTDAEVPKHKGITYFLVDMTTPGIEIRPLRQITGAAHFNEVFLNGVEVPKDNVVGEVNGGWAVTMTTLTSERTAMGGIESRRGFAEIAALAEELGLSGDPVVRQGIAATYIREQILRYLGLRTQTALSRGVPAGPESSVAKLARSRHVAATGDLIMALRGPAGALSDDWSMQFLDQWGVRIGGGTDQIQRNVIGERVLGLPAEPRVDKAIPFRELSRARVG